MAVCWLAGLIEVREFMARFVDQVPDLADLEAAFADPIQGQHHMQVATFPITDCSDHVYLLCNWTGPDQPALAACKSRKLPLAQSTDSTKQCSSLPFRSRQLSPN